MSTAIAKNFQIGADGTASNNFTLYQPATPDGTLRLGNGNTGITSSLLTLTSGGNLGLGVVPSAWSSSYKALEMGGVVSYLSSANQYFGKYANAYRNSGGTLIYTTTGVASGYLQDLGAHKWYTAPSGTAGNAISFTQAMTLDASGNLGVGTSSPSVRLHAEVTNSTNAGAAVAILRQNGSGNNGLVIDVASTPSNYVADFRIANSSVARIDSSGNLLVGTTSNTANYRVNIQQNGQGVNGIYCLSTAASSDGSVLFTLGRSYAVNNTVPFFSCVDSAATRAEIRNNGGIANYQANNVNLSDRREKTNFAPAGEYLPKICAIPVQTFNYIDQNMEEDPGTTLGVVAQDVQAVAPELVMESNWGTEENPKMRLSIYQTDLQYALMKCIQEQQAIIEQLKADVAALKGA